MKLSRPVPLLSTTVIIPLLLVGSFTLFSCTKKCALRIAEKTAKPVPASLSNSTKPELVVRRGHVGEIGATLSDTRRWWKLFT